MIRFLILILVGTFIWWLSWRVIRGFRRGSRALSTPYLEGLSSVCYGVSEIISEAAEGLLNARFDTVFVRFEEGVARLDEIFARVGAHDRSWQELKGTVERELEEIRNRLYGYHKVFTEQQKALDRGDSVLGPDAGVPASERVGGAPQECLGLDEAARRDHESA